MELESSPELRNGKKIVPVEISEGATFGELLRGLEGLFGPELAGEIYDPARQSMQHMVIATIRGVLAHNLEGTDTVLYEGDSVIFLPLAMGG